MGAHVAAKALGSADPLGGDEIAWAAVDGIAGRSRDVFVRAHQTLRAVGVHAAGGANQDTEVGISRGALALIFNGGRAAVGARRTAAHAGFCGYAGEAATAVRVDLAGLEVGRRAIALGLGDTVRGRRRRITVGVARSTRSLAAAARGELLGNADVAFGTVGVDGTRGWRRGFGQGAKTGFAGVVTGAVAVVVDAQAGRDRAD